MLQSRFRFGLAIAFAVVLFTSDAIFAQVSSALVREGESLPGDTLGTSTSSINSVAANGAGGFAFTITTDGSFSHVWGNATGGAGTVFRSEATIGDLQQTSFESFFGISDLGEVSYSASSNDTVSGTTGLDGAWVDATVVLNEEDPVPGLAGQFSTFNSRPGMTRDGQPYWVGGYSSVQGGSTQDRALFFGNSATVVLKGGDPISGIVEQTSLNAAIDFDVRFSGLGTNYICPVDVDSGSTVDDIVMVSNGTAMTAGGSILREDSPVPASVGGLAGELWDNFDYLGITESGSYLITGDTNAALAEDEFVLVDGLIVLREGDMIGAETISGSISSAYMNEDGDWAVNWVLNGVEVIIVNGVVVAREGDLVDWNGDGVIDGLDNGVTMTDITGLAALAIGDRDASGNVPVIFTADCDVSGATLEGGIRVIYDATPPLVVEAFATKFLDGFIFAGTLPDAGSSDDDYLELEPSATMNPVKQRIEMILLSEIAVSDPDTFNFRLEAAMTGGPVGDVTQTIELWDEDIQEWEVVDVGVAANADTVVEISPSGDLTRFVHPLTGEVLAKITWASLAFSDIPFFWSIDVDQAVWLIE